MFLSFELPKERIASRPAFPREKAKLLSVCRSGFKDLLFENLFYTISPGDLLVLNKTRVRPARFFAKRAKDITKFEIFLLSKLETISNKKEIWSALARPLKKLKKGDILNLAEGLFAEVGDRVEREIKLTLCSESSLAEALENSGFIPIPPYIRKGVSDFQDKEDYQTVYSSSENAFKGSLAAPTAGLHFSEDLIKDLKNEGINFEFLELEVGLSSIREIEPDKISDVKLPEEFFSIGNKLIQKIQQTKEVGRKVVAVGTTSIRALESAALFGLFGDEYKDNSFFLKEATMKGFYGTELFIKPGFDFQIIDKAITNFHLPNSSHLLIVNALVGDELTKKAYMHALNSDYRFFSYGDAMIIDRLE